MTEYNLEKNGIPAGAYVVLVKDLR
ncbi:hypothetical protein LCGC14_1811490, partial [marine sediment metagenome]